MKIGLLTFHKADSYGAVLQAHALQAMLRHLGAPSEFVEICTQPKEPESPQEAKGPAAAQLFARKMKAESDKRGRLFDEFRSEYLQVSRPYEPDERIDAEYDLFIAGSDQIWNFRIPGADARYFLPFARPEQRFSYAASFGAQEIPAKARDWVATQLREFAGLSLRERSGCRIVEDLTGRISFVHVDPTMLLPRDYWMSITQDIDGPEYDFLFMLVYDEDFLAKAQAHARENSRELKVVTAGFMPKVGMEAWNTTGVIDWLNMIRNAECVYTNSFHGAVFALLFGKELHVSLLTGELEQRNGRIEELLDRLGLSEALEREMLPDYETVWSRLDEAKQDSIDYLKGLVSHA